MLDSIIQIIRWSFKSNKDTHFKIAYGGVWNLFHFLRQIIFEKLAQFYWTELGFSTSFFLSNDGELRDSQYPCFIEQVESQLGSASAACPTVMKIFSWIRDNTTIRY
jgi:hypothetical protein